MLIASRVKVKKRRSSISDSSLRWTGCKTLRTESLEDRLPLAANFLSFDIADASGDGTLLTAFELSALSLDYGLEITAGTLLDVSLFAQKDDVTLKLGEYDSANVSDMLVNLQGFTDFAGTQEIFAVASTSDGEQAVSPSVSIDVLMTSVLQGDLTAETFFYTGNAETATVVYGSGGTDTLSFFVNPAAVTSFNGAALASVTPNSMVSSQAIYDGTTFDYLQLSDGSEIYLQGIERLSFNNGSVTELQTRPNDPLFADQWNMTIGDVPDAWRFTRGSNDVLLVSIDTGIPISNGVADFSDLTGNRLTFLGSASGSNHGHQAVSVMAATPNNNDGIAGINWGSPVLVLDVYGGDAGNIGINTAVNTAVSHLNSIPASRIVFQGGIQGEYWLNVLNNNTIPSVADFGLFAVAAGNGGQDISIASHPDGLSAGIARLEADHENVMAIGALLQSGGTPDVHGLENSNGVRLASYSNFGENLTFAAPTSTPSVRPSGSTGSFGGTSGANPVMAGYASLVWSIDPTLTAGEVRQIFAETAIDVGAVGRDSTFGHGVPNAGAAVRRAWALAENGELANLQANLFAGDGPVDTSGARIVDLTATAYQYDFGTDVSPTAVGYQRITPSVFGDISFSGFVTAEDRGASGPDDLLRDFVTSASTATLNHRLANGVWEVALTMGDAELSRNLMGVRAEQQLISSSISTPIGEFYYVDESGPVDSPTSFDVVVVDGELNIELFDNGGTDPSWVLNRLSLTRVGDVPAPIAAGDFNASQLVGADDLTIWQQYYGSAEGADGDGDLDVDGTDFLQWQRDYGIGVRSTKRLLDSVNGNGSFEDQQGATGDTVSPPLRVFSNTGTATIPGWTLETNLIAGWDGLFSGAASSGEAYAFAIGGGQGTYTSDPIDHVTANNDRFTLSFDVGNNGGTHSYVASLIFGEQVHVLGSITDNTDIANGQLSSHTFAYKASANDAGFQPLIQVVMSNSSNVAQSFFDNVVLNVTTTNLPAETSASSQSNDQPAFALSAAAAVSHSNEQSGLISRRSNYRPPARDTALPASGRLANDLESARRLAFEALHLHERRLPADYQDDSTTPNSHRVDPEAAITDQPVELLWAQL